MKDISTIFFPAQDVFTVVGTNNKSYWVNCITRLEFLHGEEHLYYLSIVVEVSFRICYRKLFGMFQLFLLFIGIASLNGFVMLAWKHRVCIALISKEMVPLKVVHVNLLIIFTNYSVFIQIGLYCRMALILYESKLVDIPGIVNYLELYTVIWDTRTCPFSRSAPQHCPSGGVQSVLSLLRSRFFRKVRGAKGSQFSTKNLECARLDLLSITNVLFVCTSPSFWT